jgi:4-hydroxy-tetrahydrodipicolinate synthase
MAARLSEAAAGVFPIAPTPFNPDQSIDWSSVDRMVDFYLGLGVQGLTILGMMGEAPKLTADEAIRLARHVLARVDGHAPVIVGVSAPGLANMVELARRAMDAGAAGVMVAPTGALRTDEQVEVHYQQVFAALGPEVPVCVQDYPPTTGVWMSVPMLVRLVRDHRQFVMFKHEDNPSLRKLSRYRRDCAAAGVRRTSVLVGAGGLYYLQELARGADGAMTGYAYPDMLAAVRASVLAGDMATAADLFDAHLPLIVLDCQPGVGLALRKEVLRRRGAIASATLRTPGVALDAADIAELDATLQRMAARVAARFGAEAPGAFR